MIRMIALIGITMMASSQPTLAQSTSNALPDLRIRKFEFLPGAQNSLRVQVANYGEGRAAACALLLVVGRTEGVLTEGNTRVRVPSLAAGKFEWVVIDASSVLPKEVSLKDTAFHLRVDATRVVRELDESNNRVFYRPETEVEKAPDLKVRQLQFPTSVKKAVKVEVGNYGQANAAQSVLRLTIRRIKNNSVERTTDEKLLPVQANSSTWAIIDATEILHENIALMGTTFTLEVDATGVVSESDETNNVTWNRHPRPQ